MTHFILGSVLFNLQLSGAISALLLLLISSRVPQCSEGVLCVSCVLHTLGLFCGPSMWPVVLSVPCEPELERNVCSTDVD